MMDLVQWTVKVEGREQLLEITLVQESKLVPGSEKTHQVE
jgi:hypothetical protein